MPRQTGHHGRATYPRMIDERWADHGAGVADQQFTSTIVIALADTLGEYDEEIHDRTRIPGVVIYEGPGRIQSMGPGAAQDIAGQIVTTTQYRVSYPRSEPLAPVGTRIKIADESLTVHGTESIEVVVTSFALSSQRFQSDLYVEANLG